jgi:hypothetical protein
MLAGNWGTVLLCCPHPSIHSQCWLTHIPHHNESMTHAVLLNHQLIPYRSCFMHLPLPSYYQRYLTSIIDASFFSVPPLLITEYHKLSGVPWPFLGWSLRSPLPPLNVRVVKMLGSETQISQVVMFLCDNMCNSWMIRRVGTRPCCSGGLGILDI